MEERILVLAPRGRDAQVIEQVIVTEALTAFICANVAEMVDALSRGASSAVVTVEALDADTLASLNVWLRNQPIWSDFPFIVLTTKHSTNNGSAVDRVVQTLGNVLLVERPVKSETLRSSIHSALRARRRQYDAREYLIEREETALLLAETDRRKDQFLAMLAHELRNPLTPIRSAGEILRKSEASEVPVVKWAGQIIARQSQQLSSLLEDLLDISRITTGKITLQLSVIELGELVSRAIETAQGAVQARQHTLTCAMLDRPLFVRVDPVRFAQVLGNLLDNAVKYTPVGGTIHIEVTVEEAQAVVSVTDNGIGISPADLPYIFEIFSQAERGLDRAQGGLGIGLSLVRSIMEMHGGSISASSNGPGKGTTMRAILPEEVGATADPQHAAGAHAAPPVRGLRILIVDDNVDAAESLALLLSMDGYRVTTAIDGLSGVAAYGKDRPDVVLLDIGLPGIDGYQVLREIRHIAGAHPPFAIAVTGYGQRQDIERSRETGFDHHLVKPVELGKLMAVLAHLAPTGVT